METVTITLSTQAAEVAYDNLYERLREETVGNNVEWLDDPTARGLMEAVQAFSSQGVSR